MEKYDRKEIPDLGTVTSGDLIEIELVIESKNDYEYILFEDMKAAGCEPVAVQSGYNGNELGAYMELRDNRVSLFVPQPRPRQTQHQLPNAGRNRRADSARCQRGPRRCTRRSYAATRMN